MSERSMSRTQTLVYAILALSALTVLSVLAWGVVTGTLSTGGPTGGSGAGAAGGAGASGSDGVPQALFGTSRGSFGQGGDGGGGRRGILVLAENGTRLRSATVPGGVVEAEITLPGRAREIVPTPGGVSVWVTFEDRSRIEVYSTRELEHEATIDPPTPEAGDDEAAAGGARTAPGRRTGPPEHLTFSETGETLFVTWAESSTISVYRHEMRELTLRGEIDAEGTVGPVFRNRRATRLFRRDEAGGLAVFFAQNGQRMGTVEGARLAEDPSLTFSADYTEAWGSTSGGRVVGLDEANSTAVVASNNVSPRHPPVMSEGVGSAVFVNEAESGILAFDISGVEISEAGGDRTASTIVDRDADGGGVEIGSLPEAGSLQLSEVMGVSGRRVASLAHTDDGAIVVVTDLGEMVTVDPSSLEVVSVAELDSGDGDGADDRAAGGVPERVVAWSVKEGGNFACF